MSYAAKHLTPVVLELGGKCPVVVDSDVNLHVKSTPAGRLSISLSLSDILLIFFSFQRKEKEKDGNGIASSNN